MSPRVVIGGGTGFIGRNLTKLLTSKGYDVKVVSRKPQKDSLTWDEIEKNGLPSDTRHVVNLAGENVLNFTKRWNDSFKDEVFKSRVNTTRILSHSINRASVKPESFVSISGVGIYPPSDSAKYDESYACEKFDFLSQLCHEWEAAADVEDGNVCHVTKLRSGVVLGRHGGMIKDLYLPFSLGLGGPIGSGKQFFPWIHIDDLTNLIVHSMRNRTRGVLNGVAPVPTTNGGFTKAFAKSLSRTAILPVPTFVFDLLFGKERAKMITQGQHVVPKETLKSGYEFKYPDIQTACDSFVKR